MGFDKDSNQPIVPLRKRTTKVNIGIIVGVLLFLVTGGAVIAWLRLHPGQGHP